MQHRSEEGKKPYMNKWQIFYGELLFSEASDHSFPPPFFAAAHIMVITSLGLLPLFIYLPLQKAVINPWWQTHGVVSSPKTPCLMKYICLINTSLSSAAFPPLWQRESPPGEKPKHSEIHMSHLVLSSRFTCRCCRCRCTVINGKLLSKTELKLLCGQLKSYLLM